MTFVPYTKLKGKVLFWGKILLWMTFHQGKWLFSSLLKFWLEGELLKNMGILLPKLLKMPSSGHKETMQKEVTGIENVLRDVFHLCLRLTLLTTRARRDEASYDQAFWSYICKGTHLCLMKLHIFKQFCLLGEVSGC